METMQDAFGTPLFEGDTVAFTHYKDSSLHRGTIERFTERRIVVNAGGAWRSTRHLDRSQVVKI